MLVDLEAYNTAFIIPGDMGRTAIEGVGAIKTGGSSSSSGGEGRRDRTVGLEGDLPDVGVILFNMGAVDKHLYSSVSNMKLDVSLECMYDHGP